MRFDIDYKTAKDMATRLQAFLADNPHPHMTRSSSIEAVARMLGFNNRNEMLVRLEGEPEAAAQGAHQGAAGASSPGLSATERSAHALYDLFLEEQQQCADMLVREGVEVLPGGTFIDAMHEDAPQGVHPLITVEDEIAERLDRDPRRRDILFAALLVHSAEMDGAGQVRRGRASQVAMALVNEAMTLAERQWDSRASADLLEDVPDERGQDAGSPGF